MVYIKHHGFGAGKWIYQGYANAFRMLDYEVEEFVDLASVDDDAEIIMTTDSSINTEEDFVALGKAEKVFLFCQPTHFPEPWGKHPNFVCTLPADIIDTLNKCRHIVQWTFTKPKYHDAWKNICHIPLAFDHVTYRLPRRNTEYEYDVCFIGGRANNGFDEKAKIMQAYFDAIEKTGAKCGFFVDQNLTNEQERDILYNSKIAINIHDAYQQKLGLDINERSYKALALSGFMISDSVAAMSELFPEVPQARSPQHMAELAQQYLSQDLREIKEKNREMILSSHTYVERVKRMLEL